MCKVCTDDYVQEYQSFTDLKFSKDKVINWIEWHPVIKGVIAVACGESYSADERVELATRLTSSRSLILLWSFTDPIHPQVRGSCRPYIIMSTVL